MRSRGALGAILLAIVVASCSGPHDVSVSVDGTIVGTARVSETYRTACSTSHGDYFPREVPLTTARTGSPKIEVRAGTGVTRIRGWIYDADAPPGGPIEEFTISSASGSYTPRTMMPGRTYQVVVNAEWSFVVTGGEDTVTFKVRLEAP